jgi:long-chain-fatty-acid--[acyl-carrier-protein] ligase
MALFWITVATLLAGFGLGYVKFFLLSILGAHALGDKTWLIQEVGAIITLGPFLIFWAAAPLASSFMKRHIMATAGLMTFLLLSLGAVTNWYGSLWFYLFGSGLIMGFFNPAKNAAIPLEAKHGNHSTEGVNATLNISLLLGILSGIPTATYLHAHDYNLGLLVLLLAFFGCGTAGLLCYFKQEEQHIVPYKQARASFVSDTRTIATRYRSPLLISGLIWGLANAISLAVTAYAETTHLGNSFECSLMSVYAIIGVSLGNIIAVFLSKMRRFAVIIGLFLLMVATCSIPIFCTISIVAFGTASTYRLLATLVMVLGTGFGMSSNLVEAQYYRGIYDDKMEGTGGALLSAATAVSSSLLGLAVGAALQLHVLGPQSQFVVLALLVLFPLVFFLQSEDAEGWWHSWAARLARILLTIRYRLTFSKLSCIPESGPVLILPNHPAEVDPIILGSHIWKTRPVIPLMIEAFYELPGVKTIMRSIGTIAVPDLEFDAGPHKLRRVEKAFTNIIDSLKKGRAVLMYPSGRLQRGGKELLGSTSGLKTILQALPEVPIVLVRTTGLYGSTFSCAFSGLSSPDFFYAIKEGIKTALLNGILFAPKRSVYVECALADDSFPRNGTIREINAWLESWYNQPGSNEAALVPNRFWSSETKVPAQEAGALMIDVESVDPTLKAKVFSFLVTLSQKPAINAAQSLRDDLALDSLLLTELLTWLEEECNAFDVAITDLTTVASVLKVASDGLISGHHHSGHDHCTIPESAWNTATRITKPSSPTATNLLDAFLNIAKARSNEEACGDTRAGILTWKKVLRGTYLLRRAFQSIPEQRVGVLLPAAVSTNITIMALIAAGKTPVLINWTLGSKVVREILAESNVSTVLSSRAFLDQVPSDLQSIENTIVYLEEVVTNSGFIGLIRSWLDLIIPPTSLPSPKPDETAVILFTSGSEALPKGVPLSHHNILTNIKDALSIIPLESSDILYGFLPPFHSFGLTITTFLPLVSGVRAAYHPNPTEARKLARGIAQWGITIVSGTPTFLRNLIIAATPNQLRTLRLMLAGAEKTPQSLIELTLEKTPQAILLEGYGITECSPIVSVNRPNEERYGVGQPLPSVQVRTIHPESHEPLNSQQDGLLIVSGPSIFNGYLSSKPNPFISLDSRVWYNTGDLGRIENGRIVLSGRMKRFIKIGGEMISLQALEDTLLQLSPSRDDEQEFLVAVVAYEPPDGARPIIGLYSTVHLDLDVVNLFLREQGFSTIAKINSIEVVAELPMLGTGKCDVRRLQEEFKERICAGAAELSTSAQT